MNGGRAELVLRLAQREGWTCVFDATSDLGRGPLRRAFPKDWHRIERLGVRPPPLRAGVTVSQVFRGGWVEALFAQHAGQSRKRERVCARRVVHAIGQLPVVLVDERVLARLERHLLQHAGSGKRPLSNELVRRAMRLTRKAVFRLQMQMKQVPKVGLSVKGPRRRLGVILYRRTGAVRELEAVYRCLPNAKVRAAVALICAGASEAEVQRMKVTDLGTLPWIWVPDVRNSSQGRWLVLPAWAQRAVRRWVTEWPRSPVGLLFPSRDNLSRPMTSLTPGLKKASQRAGVSPFTVSRVRQVFPALGRKFGLARGLVRRSLVHDRAKDWQALKQAHPHGYGRLMTVMASWERLGSVPPSVWEGVRVPRRAPKGTRVWVPEAMFRGRVPFRSPAQPTTRKLRRPKKRTRAGQPLRRVVLTTRPPIRSVSQVAGRKKQRLARPKPAQNPYPPVQLCGPEPPLPPVDPSVKHMVAKPAKPNRNYAKPAQPWPWNQKK